MLACRKLGYRHTTREKERQRWRDIGVYFIVITIRYSIFFYGKYAMVKAREPLLKN